MPIKGYPGQKSLDRTNSRFCTVEPTGDDQYGLTVISHSFTREIATGEAVEANSTVNLINDAAHSVRRGDILVFDGNITAAIAGAEVRVHEILDANSFDLANDLPATPAVGDTYTIQRHKGPAVDASGAVNVTSGPLLFTRDGADQEVVEDTGTPANNRPLPVKLTSATGDINITANDLNISSNHANDSMRLGDGTTLTNVSLAGELQTKDDGAIALLTTIDADTSNLDVLLSTRASEATLAAINAKLVDGTDIGDVTVNNAGGASAVNIQDGGNSITVDDGGTPLSVDDGGGSLTIDATALPLPNGAATELTLAAAEVHLGNIDSDTTTIAGDTTSLDSKLPTQGQALMAASVPVAIASDQSGVPITDNGGSLTVDDGGVSLTVDATDLDIRDIDHTTDSIEARQTAHDNLNANANMQVGNADVGVLNPVPVFDNGGSITVDDGGISLTVDATDLDIRDLDSTQDSVECRQLTRGLLLADVTIQVADTDVSNANPVPVSDAGGSLTVDATNLDIRDLTSVSDSVEARQSTHDNLNSNSTIQIQDADVTDANPVPIKIGSGQSIPVTVADLDVLDQIDNAQGPLLDTATTNIPSLATANAQIVVASLAANVKEVYVADTTGKFIGVYNKLTPASVDDGLEFIINPGMDRKIPVSLASGSAVYLRNMENAVINNGQLIMQFLG